MPAFRNIRRSRRISRQPPRDPNSDEYDVYDLNLMYPDGSGPSSPIRAQKLGEPLPPADEAGKSEVDHISPSSTAAQSSTLTGQRSSHSRKRKPGHIPRPPNAFMIFRSELWNKEKIKSTVERDHRQISRIAGSLWNELTESEREPYRMRADEAKHEHTRLYPEYKYSPVYRRDKPAKRKPRVVHTEKVHRAHQVVRLFQRGFQGDELEREMREREARKDEDDYEYSSDASEYVETHRHMKARASTTSKKRIVARPRRPSRRLKVEYTSDEEQEPALVSLNDAPFQNAFPKELCLPEDVSAPPASAGEGNDHFVPTGDIPDFSLGEPAYNSEIQFTNPFADGGCLPLICMSPFAPHDPLSPAASCTLSDDFLGSTGEERHPALSSPDDTFIGIFDVRPDPSVAVYDNLKSEYMSMFDPGHPYHAPQYVPGQISAEPDFADWVREDSYE